MPLPHDGEIVVVVVVVVLVVVVLPGVVVVVVADPWTSAATSATKASTLASMPPASPPVVQDPRPSALENADAKALSHRCRQGAGTETPRLAAVALQRSLHEHFLPAARSLDAAQSFSAGSSVHRSSRTSWTCASTLPSMAAASPFVEHMPLLSAFANADVKCVSAFARHSPSTAPPFAAAFATHLAFAAHFLPVAVSFEALQVFPCAATGVLVIASTQSVAKTELAGALTMAIPPSAVVWSRQPQAFRLSGASSPSSRPRPSSSPYVPGGDSIMQGSRVGADALNRLIPRRRLDCTSPARAAAGRRTRSPSRGSDRATPRIPQPTAPRARGGAPRERR